VVRNTIVLASARYYRKFSKHTVATRFATKLGYELDETRQFTLGADSGLRGYPARQFTGEKLVLMNLEDRQFWGKYSIGPAIDLGTVVFVDAGNAWKEEEDIDLAELNWSTGFGFRIGFSNLPKQPIFRIDFGWVLSDVDNMDDTFAVTIGQEQQF
jgi:hemolysin activation/secretion protein